MGLRGARGLRGLLWGRVGSGPGWHCAEGAWLCLQLLGKRREHAEVGKVLDVIVAGPLGGIPGHGQHVLKHLGLPRRLVRVLLTALLPVVLALPL